jgi:hypothetical protein
MVRGGLFSELHMVATHLGAALTYFILYHEIPRISIYFLICIGNFTTSKCL